MLFSKELQIYAYLTKKPKASHPFLRVRRALLFLLPKTDSQLPSAQRLIQPQGRNG